jgi:cell shape-determining protein MreC
MAKYQYQQHPHTQTREHQPASKAIAGFNNRLGSWITTKVGTMWAAYAFAALALISLPSAISTGEVRVIVDWIAQTFLQLVLVSVIIVGQNQQTARAEMRAEATYKDATALLHEVQQLQQHLAHQDAELQRLREDLGKDLGK